MLLRPRHACILTLPCGFGKTVVSLGVARSLGRKTLVVVHKQVLMLQWEARIQEFLPGARVCRIQGPQKGDENCDFAVAMLQTLCSYGGAGAGADASLDVFGTVVLDEAHHMAARSFSRLFFKLRCRYVLGLTATPRRKDGCTNVLHLHMGSFSYCVEDRGCETVKVCCVPWRSAARTARETTAVETQRVKTRLTHDESRNRCLVRLCVSLADQGRQVPSRPRYTSAA